MEIFWKVVMIIGMTAGVLAVGTLIIVLVKGIRFILKILKK